MTSHRRQILRRTALLGSGLFGTASGTAVAAASETDDGRIEGTITHFGTPVDEATVTADDGTETTTDETGSYTLSLEPGKYTLMVTAPGYTPVSTTINAANDETRTREFALEREWGPGTGELEVYATPVGGGSTIPCEITVFGDDRYDVTASRGSIPDGDRWGSGFDVSEGWWEILVTDAEGYSDGYQEVRVEDGETAFGWVQLEAGDDEISETGRIEGRVVDPNGTAVTDATVRTGGARVSVDGEGEFDLELEHGQHSLVIDAVGYQRVTGDVQVKFGRTTELNVTVRPSAPGNGSERA
ncbi:carboxypeptidase-like regulatory domain-containing protein [Natrinema versiforme]|uniref:Carboxypeptidase regulatory-like domain-containing protein n=1 Tax=Natrinema versiforme TaxID=88724 RepID=A0A4P8WH26_9EURY|nr:carboxypeptidase-like regulatory domain-containing protein [Natrinema versiforme]QCS42444.1 carboxypeptidase regulatory-like domain-containing protein [Natrinema versiforme]